MNEHHTHAPTCLTEGVMNPDAALEAFIGSPESEAMDAHHTRVLRVDDAGRALEWETRQSWATYPALRALSEALGPRADGWTPRQVEGALSDWLAAEPDAVDADIDLLIDELVALWVFLGRVYGWRYGAGTAVWLDLPATRDALRSAARRSACAPARRGADDGASPAGAATMRPGGAPR